MSQKKKVIVIVILLVLVAAVIYLLVFFKKASPKPNLAVQPNQNLEAQPNPNLITGPITPPSEEVLVNNANPNLYSFAGDSQAEEITVEFMGDAEKTSLGIPTAARIQVLERDADGKCIAWKMINQDSEILHEYVK
jgi:flagellar basal body-associated protein FliL